jgi:glycerol-3-phosphate dehydrogenase (NAD+)
VIPHQFIERSFSPLRGKLKPGAECISLVKGFDIVPTGGIQLISSVLKQTLGVPVAVLMGANLAGEVADGHFCETTIGCNNVVTGSHFKALFQTPNFRVTVVNDATTVEICGALKNIVACAAGFVQGLKYGDNTKSAVIRIGLMEMIKYAKEFGEEPKLSTFFESCGVADLVTTCYGGRNSRLSTEFILQKKSISDLENEMLNGQKLQGPETAAEVNFMLKKKGMEDHFPLFTAVHRIFINEMKPEQLIDMLRDHPVHAKPEEYAHL